MPVLVASVPGAKPPTGPNTEQIRPLERLFQALDDLGRVMPAGYGRAARREIELVGAGSLFRSYGFVEGGLLT